MDIQTKALFHSGHGIEVKQNKGKHRPKRVTGKKEG